MSACGVISCKRRSRSKCSGVQPELAGDRWSPPLLWCSGGRTFGVACPRGFGMGSGRVRQNADRVESPLRRLAADLAMAVRIFGALLTSMVLPERSWRPLTRGVGRAIVWSSPGWKRAALAKLNRRLGEGDSTARREILIDLVALGHQSRLYGLREYRPGQREHQVRIIGTDIAHDGLAAGNGLILWIARFVFSSIVTKIALHEAGFAVSHLSRPTHGFSTSRFGIRWLNPVWTGIEERFLRERIIMSEGGQIAALRRLHTRLADNQVVSITVGDEGVQTVTVDFLEGELRLATGPISLAVTTGATLIPVFTVRTASGELEVELQAPLDVPAEADRHRRFTLVGEQYAGRLAPFVERYPGQWLG